MSSAKDAKLSNAEAISPDATSPPDADTEFRLWDQDLAGYGLAGLFGLNGIATSLKGGLLLESGVYPAFVIAIGAHFYSQSKSNSHMAIFASALTTLYYGGFKYLKNNYSFVSPKLLSVASLAICGRYSYQMLRHRMKLEKEEESAGRNEA